MIRKFYQYIILLLKNSIIATQDKIFISQQIFLLDSSLSYICSYQKMEKRNVLVFLNFVMAQIGQFCVHYVLEFFMISVSFFSRIATLGRGVFQSIDLYKVIILQEEDVIKIHMQLYCSILFGNVNVKPVDDE